MGPDLLRRTARRLDAVGFLSNLLGASVVGSFLLFLVPGNVSDDEFGDILGRSLPLFALYMAVTLPLGRALVTKRAFAPIERWLLEQRPATREEQEIVLRYPLRWVLLTVPYWIGAALLFSLVNASAGASVALVIAATSLLGGLTACALQYLLVDRALRPVTAQALAGGPPEAGTPGVEARLTTIWALATAVPLLGALAIGVADLAGAYPEGERVVPAMAFLCALGLAVGFVSTRFASRSVAEPLGAMRGALQRVEAGQMEVSVPVEDGSEVGLLQAGFNRMARGLAERERLREAFGTFVDPDLAQRVIEEGTDLAGEEVELSILFCDVRGFSAFSERSPAREVVAALNALYARVVPIVLAHGGHANKFVGDGLLAVFGAPERHPDHADRAVAAALEIVRAGGGGLRVGAGVNSGRAVVGTVGGGGRLDFTVIGDAVNTAARVEAATRETGDDVLITGATRERLRRGHGSWVQRPPMTLRGKREPVALYAPERGVLSAP